MNTLTDRDAKQIGQQLVELLGLRPIRVAAYQANQEPRYDLSTGDKTAIGLARTVLRVFQDAGIPIGAQPTGRVGDGPGDTAF